jgi:hypothetical protein
MVQLFRPEVTTTHGEKTEKIDVLGAAIRDYYRIVSSPRDVRVYQYQFYR